MTNDEFIEYHYRFTERLGMLCGTDDPTQAQIDQAKTEADDAVKAMRGNSNVVGVAPCPLAAVDHQQDLALK